ncbi:MAG: peptide ABC transporter substrate-binding protein [Bacillus sp. (in: firmicutes)]
MKKSKFSLLLILTLALSVFLAACSGDKETGSKGKEDGDADKKTAAVQELRVLETAEVPTMDSSKVTDTMGFTMLNNVNEGLYRQNEKNELIPAIAEGEPEVKDVEGGNVFTVKMKEGLTWSNDAPITANDFVFAWQRAIDPATVSDYGPYMMVGKIAGAKEITEAAAAKKEVDLNQLGVKAIDDLTLEITTAKPMTVEFFKGLMAFGTFLPLNEEFVKEQGDKYAATHENILYNGPFVMTDWNGPTATEWVLEKNEKYRDADNVDLTKITFNVSKDPQATVNAFEAGEADVTGKMGSDVLANYEGDDRLKRDLSASLFYIKINQTQTEALKNVKIRKAISMAFNKEDAAKAVLANGSVAANYAVPRGFAVDEKGKDFRDINGDDVTGHNVEEAKKLWKEGLEEEGLTSLEIGYLGGDTETSKKYDQYIVDQLQTNLEGLKVKLESVPFAVRLDRDTKQEYDLQAAGWGPDYMDPISFSNLWVTDGGNNKTGYSNKEYDKLIEESEKETDSAKRWQLLADAEKIVIDEAAIAPTYQRADNILVAEKVDGLVKHVVGPEYSYQWVKITE